MLLLSLKTTWGKKPLKRITQKIEIVVFFTILFTEIARADPWSDHWRDISQEWRTKITIISWHRIGVIDAGIAKKIVSIDGWISLGKSPVDATKPWCRLFEDKLALEYDRPMKSLEIDVPSIQKLLLNGGYTKKENERLKLQDLSEKYVQLVGILEYDALRLNKESVLGTLVEIFEVKVIGKGGKTISVSWKDK